MDFTEVGWGEGGCSGFIWLRTEASDRFFWTRQWTFQFHRMCGISWLAKEMLDFQGGLN